MTNDAHNMSLITFIIDGVAHGLSVYGKTFVLFCVYFVPALQGAIQVRGIDADKNIPDDRQAGDNVTAAFATATETLSRFLAKAVGPIRDSLISAHATQDSSGCDAQNRGQSMSPSFGTAGIGNSLKEGG
jgi:hypothetical protein